jgi:hypothetical protein
MRTERYGTKLPREVEIKDGEHLEGIHLVFAYAAGSVRGAVKFENGTPLQHFHISIFQNESF